MRAEHSGCVDRREVIWTNIFTASYDVIPPRHVHAHVHSNWNVGSIGEDEFDVLELSSSSPCLCERDPDGEGRGSDIK